MTHCANFSIVPFVCLAFAVFIGMSMSRAGSIVIDKMQAIMTPNAVRLPRSLITGTSEKLSVINPMAVVIEVIQIGIKFSCIL